MMRCTRTLILFLALLLTNCTATSLPAMPGSATTVTTTLPPAITASPSPTATMTAGGAPAATATNPLTTPLAPAPAPTETPSSTARPAPTWPPGPIPTQTDTAVPETPSISLSTNANLRAGPGTAYPVIGGGRSGQVLPVLAQYGGWWQTPRGWVSGSLAQPNAAASTPGRVPELASVPAPPTAEVKVEAKAEPTPTSTSTLSSAAPLPDLVVLGPDTQYPVRARVVQGWDYEFSDLSAQYDIIVYRDVFGMLAHQIDDENVRRYGRQSRFGRYGPLRITLVDAQPHPDPACPGWGWAPDRDTFVDPYGMTQDPCKVEHSLFPQGDGAGTTLLIGWGYNAGTTLAIGAAGSYLGDVTTSFFAEALPWPGDLGPADRPDFSQPLYRPLGAAHKEDGRWVWQDPFAEVVPTGQ